MTLNQSFSDIIKIQEEITSSVSEKLKSEIHQLASSRYSNSITNNSESYRLYLKGKYLLEKRTEDDIYKAIECFQKSIFYDPINVYSYVEMVECYSQLYASDLLSYKDYLVKTEPFLSAIAKLNESLDIVQVMYGKKLFFDWKFNEAEKHLQKSLLLNPNNLVAHYRYIEVLMALGKFSETLKELKQIIQIDPLSFRSYLTVGRAFYKIGQYENAINFLNDTLELEPNNYEALAVLGATLTELGNCKEALSVFQKSLDINYNLEVLSMLGYVNALVGKKNIAFEIIDDIQNKGKSNHEYQTILSRIYLALGEKEIAYSLLERAFELHEIDLNVLKTDPRWTQIRNESRFKELVSRIGLPTD